MSPVLQKSWDRLQFIAPENDGVLPLTRGILSCTLNQNSQEHGKSKAQLRYIWESQAHHTSRLIFVICSILVAQTLLFAHLTVLTIFILWPLVYYHSTQNGLELNQSWFSICGIVIAKKSDLTLHLILSPFFLVNEICILLLFHLILYIFCDPWKLLPYTWKTRSIAGVPVGNCWSCRQSPCAMAQRNTRC